ncbi:MAG TPA: BON domain-containing protein, partial [Thermoanaerobaculia bacterium]|nr:BON domain-containing protein [Thermoanaerobaculia bacterium]
MTMSPAGTAWKLPIIFTLTVIAIVAVQCERKPAVRSEPGAKLETPAEQQVPSRQITAAIERDLASSRRIDADRIAVQTFDGIVTLSGTSDNLISKMRAERIAGMVRGVRSIINRIRVEGPAIPDDQLSGDVSAALKSDAGSDAWPLTVHARDGRVTLLGTLPSWRQAQLATRIAMGVRGVREVVSNLGV